MNRDPKQSGDHLDAFLKGGDPVEQSALTGGGIESALDEIGAEITGRSRQAGSRWSRRPSISKSRAALLIGFATIGIGAAVAGGSQLSAHTGHFKPTVQEIAQVAKTNPEKARMMQAEVGGGGPGEDLKPSAPDFREVALQYSSDIPFPKAYEQWREVVSAEAAGPETDVLETSGAIRGLTAMSAFCAWVLDWRYAEMTGNSEVAAEDATVISEAPTWKAVTDEDLHLDPAAGVTDGKSRLSLFGWMLPFRDAVLAGDRAQV
ncbi:MAG: hypothetical protein ABSC36_01090, partial [Gaiellaceae bacterium]